MKQLTLMLLVLVLIASTGCSTYSGLSVNQYNTNGSRKNVVLHPYGKGDFEISFINKSSQPIFINIDKKIPNFHRISSGESWTYHSQTKKDVDYTIKWWYKHNNLLDENEKELTINLSALYKQKKVVIDDNFLRNKILQRGVVVNYHQDPVTIYDSQGNNYGELKPGEIKYAELISGPVTFYFVKKDKLWNTRNVQTFSLEIDTKNNVFFNGEWIGWRFFVR